MAEWSNAAVLKTVILYPRNRGFESLFLRQSFNEPRVSGVFYFHGSPKNARILKVIQENKNYPQGSVKL